MKRILIITMLVAVSALAEQPEIVDTYYNAPPVDYISPAPAVPYTPDVPERCLGSAYEYYKNINTCYVFQPAPEYDEALFTCLDEQNVAEKKLKKAIKKCGKKCRNL